MEKITTLLTQTEDVLSDILLSGFQGVHLSTLEEIDYLIKCYTKYEMHTATNLLTNLKSALLKRKNSFEYNIEDIMQYYSKLEFYIQTING